MRRHLASPKKDERLQSIRVVIGERFNKSVCLDLESHLIRWFHGDGQYSILNGNDGLSDARYYDRDIDRESFRDVFEALRADGAVQPQHPADREQRPVQALAVQGAHRRSSHPDRRHRRGPAGRSAASGCPLNPRRAGRSGHRQDDHRDLPDEAARRYPRLPGP
ncbi:hypothetical protein PQI51_10980 [Microbacterium esteraromaticum]